jgi:hypothetical protein
MNRCNRFSGLLPPSKPLKRLRICIYTAYTPLKQGVNGSASRRSRRTASYFMPQRFQRVSEFLQA